MKQQIQVPSSTHSKSQVDVPQMRASRAPPPKVKQLPATPGPGVKARPRPAAAATTMAATRRQAAVSMPMPVRRIMMSTTESETVEDEVVRLRGEVDALRRELQRLLRLNAELQHQQHDAATNNRPQPPSKISISGGVVVAAPPPPLPRHQNQRAPSAPSTSPVSKATALVDMYNSLQTGNKKSSKHTDQSRSHHHHSSIVDELQNRSRHLLAVRHTPSFPALCVLSGIIIISSLSKQNSIPTIISFLNHILYIYYADQSGCGNKSRVHQPSHQQDPH